MELSTLESDLIGDLSKDSHGLWEVFEFVKLHHPSGSDQEVFNRGRELLASWLARGWLRIAANPKPPGGISESALLQVIDRLGSKAMLASDELPWIDLSEKAFRDVSWLRKPSNFALNADAQKPRAG
jgi:hypothetical protein